MQESFPLSDDGLGLDPRVMLIQRAVEGDRHATGQLLAVLTPVIRSSVAAVLARAGGGRRQARQEVEDTVQSVLLALFADRGRVLLQWDPARGLKLESFVALLAKRETVSILRSRRRNPFTEDPTLNEDLDRNPVARMGPESEAISRDMVMALALAVQARLTPKAAELFDLLFIRGLPNEEVNALTGLSIDAIYAWRSRLAKQVKEIVTELQRQPVQPPAPAHAARWGEQPRRREGIAPARGRIDPALGGVEAASVEAPRHPPRRRLGPDTAAGLRRHAAAGVGRLAAGRAARVRSEAPAGACARGRRAAGREAAAPRSGELKGRGAAVVGSRACPPTAAPGWRSPPRSWPLRARIPRPLPPPLLRRPPRRAWRPRRRRRPCSACPPRRGLSATTST